METIQRPSSIIGLLVISCLTMLITLMGFGLSDQINSFDFLTPLIGILQFVFVIGLYLGKIWGLIGYSFTCLGLPIVTMLYYLNKGQAQVGLTTSLVFIPLIGLAIWYWTAKRAYFTSPS